MPKLLTASLMLVAAVCGASAAQVYPDHTVKIVVPASPGGVTDFIGRMLAQNLTEKWNTSVIVENRVGGGTLIGANAVAKAPPDGHTMLVMPLGTLFNSIISKTMPINFEKDLAPVAVLADQSLVLVVNADLPIHDVKDLTAYAKTKPDALSYGTVGPGSLPDVAMALFKSLSDTKMVAIPYGGNTPAMTDLLSGRIQLLFLPLGSALPHMKSGKVRALGVSSPMRDRAAADIPSISESLPGYSVVTWQALMTTGGTPEDIIDLVNKDVHEVTAKPEVLARFKDLHLSRRKPVDAKTDKAFILSEFHKWQPVLRGIGLAK